MRSLVWMVVIVLSVQAAHAQISRARVTGGEVSGTAENGISIFKGIPFAAPPVGQFDWNMWTWAREQSRLGKGKVFSYYYDHHAPQAEGSGHGSDVPFHFETLATRGTPRKEDLALSDMISSYDVNFAKTGDPNGAGLPPRPAFTDQNQQVMVFDATPGARTYPLLDRVKVLDRYFDRLRKAQ